jgi:D-glycero-D-manno-heptose 1,7-bisphosphate phosphatase
MRQNGSCIKFMNRAVFLDRDGVINRSILVNGVPKPPLTIEDVEILEGAVYAIKILKAHGFIPVVITNQPDVARGKVSRLQVEVINRYLAAATSISYFYSCFHDDIDGCSCRKPAPGLINTAAADLDIDIPNSYLVGDRWRDIAAGQAAGCPSLFIDYSYQERTPEKPFRKVSSLEEAAKFIIGAQYGAE